MSSTEKILRLSAAYALMDGEVQEAIAVALRIPLKEVVEFANTLADQSKLLDDVASVFFEGGGATSTLEEMLAAMEDPNPDHTTDWNAEAKRDLVDTYKDDFFGSDER